MAHKLALVNLTPHLTDSRVCTALLVQSVSVWLRPLGGFEALHFTAVQKCNTEQNDGFSSSSVSLLFIMHWHAMLCWP